MWRLWGVALAGAAAVCTGAFAQQSLVERGSYLVNGIMACGNCHTPREAGQPVAARQLSGGFQTFDEPWFTTKGSNITPDRETGIGAWSDADFERAMREGVRRNGGPIAPIMPFPFYKSMTPADLAAVRAYLVSVPAINNAVQAPVYKKEAFKVPYPDAQRVPSEADLKDPVKRGAYLAGLGHCMACHARRDESEPPDFKGLWGKGGRTFKSPAGVAVTANITAHKEKGLGAWTDADIKRALVDGVSKDGRKLKPPMVDYAAYYKRLTAEDLDALVAWLRSIPPLE